MKLGELLQHLSDKDLLIITADHGNDPTYKGTDHTREKVPFIAYSSAFESAGDLGEKEYKKYGKNNWYDWSIEN